MQLYNIFEVCFKVISYRPTSTENEELPEDYYLAELNGLSDRCSVYYKMCPKSVLKLISREYF